MILEAILYPIFVLLKVFVLLIPTINVQTILNTGIADFVIMISRVSYFLPVGYTFVCLGIIFSFDNFKTVLFVFNFLIKKIPTI